MDGNLIYVDLENTGGRNYPGEVEDRKVVFNIANSEQITNMFKLNFNLLTLTQGNCL